MTVEEAIRHRRTIRHFLPDPVSVAEIRQMLTLATLAPNVANRQMWRFIVIVDEALLRMLAGLVERKLHEISHWPGAERQQAKLAAWREQALHFAEAPAVLVVVDQGYHSPLDSLLVEHGLRANEVEHMFGLPDVQSVAAMVAYFTLVAEDRGYGTCWMTHPLVAKKDLQAALETKVGEEIVALVALGKPADYPPPKARKPIDEIIEWR